MHVAVCEDIFCSETSQLLSILFLSNFYFIFNNKIQNIQPSLTSISKVLETSHGAWKMSTCQLATSRYNSHVLRQMANVLLD